MRLLAGLGNPGDKYADTRHNAGFWCVDQVAKELGLTWREFRGGELAEARFDGEKTLLFKPMDFMNRSGFSLRQACDYFKVDEFCVAADDVYLLPGTARIRKGGESGGHNGLKSVTEQVDDAFWRVKIGVGLYEQRPELRQRQAPLDEYVLQRLPGEERELVAKLIDRLVPDLIKWLQHGEMREHTLRIDPQSN